MHFYYLPDTYYIIRILNPLKLLHVSSCIHSHWPKKSTWWDDAVFVQVTSQLIPTYYPLTRKACSKLLLGITVNLPGFGNEKFWVRNHSIEEVTRVKTEIKIKTKIGSAFMKGRNDKGVKFAYLVTCQTPMKKNLPVV